MKIERRAKYILIHLEGDMTWIIHLGMSGRILIQASTQGKHDHVVWQTDNQDQFVYNDPRRFGLMDLSFTSQLNKHKLFSDLGMEPLDDALTPQILHEMFLKTQRPIKAVLLDQKVIAGLGNIYVCEALWMTNLSPYRASNTLTFGDVCLLLDNIRIVLKNAIAAGGSTLKDYAKPDGELGYFQHQFSAYGRENQRCLNDGCRGEIVRKMQSGRSTFYCPDCAV